MKFVRGMIVGATLGAGIAMMYTEGMLSKKAIMKKGKQFAKKIGKF